MHKHGAHPSTYGGEQWLGMAAVPARAVTLWALPESPQKRGSRIHVVLAPLPALAMGALPQPGPAQGELVLQEVTTLWELARCSRLECDG